MNPPIAAATPWAERWQRFSAASRRAFHAYASWLVSISWTRFWLLSLLLLAGVGILHDLPPFTWQITERVMADPDLPAPPGPPASPKPPPPPAREPKIHIQTPKPGASAPTGVDITIDANGIRITPRNADAPASAASTAAPASGAGGGSAASAAAEGEITISLPPGADKAAVKEAVEAAKAAIREAIEAQQEAARDAAEAARDAAQAARDLGDAGTAVRRSLTRTTRVGIGDALMQFTLLWVIASVAIKYTYKGRMQAEALAAKASETAESESLKRQVIEARMAAMQAQVEPHFLFNTLASIDHLIETDPARASVMQKNLIALLRASMPTMREASDGGVRDLGRELAVIRPYLEILKVRMEERLSTVIDVPDGLLSAEFPPMMMQTLVENAIKHGLEPKAEGGSLKVKAEVVHGALAVSVADTGLGFGRAATAGTGVGLANIRERLQLLYGRKASLTVAENPGGGTLVTITVPYKPVAAAGVV
jgi:signal transduction histidine kinase